MKISFTTEIIIFNEGSIQNVIGSKAAKELANK
jgi:hypothetical protein